jgi:hypothetical protein
MVARPPETVKARHRASRLASLEACAVAIVRAGGTPVKPPSASLVLRRPSRTRFRCPTRTARESDRTDCDREACRELR